MLRYQFPALLQTSSVWSVLALVCILHVFWSNSANADETREIQVRQTSDNVRYGLIGEVPSGNVPAPTLFVFAHGIEDMRRQLVYSEVSVILAKQGWISVVIDPPCHGEDVRAGEPPQLDGWRHRIEHEDDFISAFNAKARSVLDVLIKDGVTDRNEWPSAARREAVFWRTILPLPTLASKPLVGFRPSPDSPPCVNSRRPVSLRKPNNWLSRDWRQNSRAGQSG